ncbi:DUF5693 family protein [Geotoga petraea]|uniref:Uncharacterized protein n=1 Tax=Geotoga petraea TaxID=28234 RepID=A0A1G6I9L4_9BACT|nr:DUF5693 family protein [Geotoga petraea]MDK2945513.1 hypothetical protein [Geotoga sp.]SDC03130.1 hypothetical protein SAMN04488588_0297 [Geotoga petraea]
MKKFKKIFLYINIIFSIIFTIFISYYDFKNTQDYSFINKEVIEKNSIIMIKVDNQKEFLENIKNYDHIFIAEFSPSDEVFLKVKNSLTDEFLKKIKYVHYIKPEELDKYSNDIVVRRFIRAFEERKIQYFYIPDHEKKASLVENIEKYLGEPAYYKDIEQSYSGEYLKYISNILISANLLIYMPIFFMLYFVSLLFFYNWSFTIAGLFLSYIIFFKISNKNVFKIVLYSIIFGILIYASGFDFNFIFKLNTIRGVKIVLLGLPFFIFIKYLYSKKFDKFYKSDIIILIIGLLGVFLYLIRSNNWGFVLDIERQIRDFLDQYLIARPRTKELISYFFFFTKPFDTYFGKLIWILGKSILPVSIINTFLHFHTPIYLGILRTVNAFLIALIILVFIIMIKKLIYFRGKS